MGHIFDPCKLFYTESVRSFIQIRGSHFRSIRLLAWNCSPMLAKDGNLSPFFLSRFLCVSLRLAVSSEWRKLPSTSIFLQLLLPRPPLREHRATPSIKGIRHRVSNYSLSSSLQLDDEKKGMQSTKRGRKLHPTNGRPQNPKRSRNLFWCHCLSLAVALPGPNKTTR